MNVAYLLDRQAGLAPDGPAILLEDGGTRSWADVRDRVARFAGALVGRGVKRGDRVAILSLNGPFYIEASLALARIGAITQTMNMRLSPAELRFQVEDAATKLMLVHSALAGLAEQAAPEVAKIVLDGDAGGDGYEGLLEKAEPVADPVMLSGDDVLSIFYTSGTTGTPKGVMVTHGNILANAAFLLPTIGYAADDVTLHAAPMFHVSDFCATFAQLMAGGQHAFVPRFDPRAVLEAVQRYKATNIILVPTMINMLVRHEAIGDYDLGSWRFLFYGGSPMPEDTLRRCFEVLPCALYQGYGQTEATHTICVLTADDHRRALDEPALLRSCGRPMTGIEVRVVDGNDAPLPAGEIGEVVVRAPNVMKGYWKREEETREALRGGWLHTGDLGRMDGAGYLSLVDRMKDMIISGGENVYSAEVENALAGHPAMVEAAVIAVPDKTLGEHVHAVVVVAEGRRASEADLSAHCRKSIAGYKVPRSYEFADALPKTAAGKVQKMLLREPHWKDRSRSVD